MSLGIVFKGPEGIVLAADSRVTITAEMRQPGKRPVMIPATYDNATKLLRLQGQAYVGAVTFGAGTIGLQEPRTAHSYLNELEVAIGSVRLPVEEVAKRISAFFLEKWQAASMPAEAGDMVFFVSGFDEGAVYGRVFEVLIPSRPVPKEWHEGAGQFGAIWGGQREYVDRLIKGYDLQAPQVLKKELGLLKVDVDAVVKRFDESFQVPIPYQFLSLQDSINLSILLIRLTIGLQSFAIGVRGVGGAIDVARITQSDGIRAVQEKVIKGEQTPWSF